MCLYLRMCVCVCYVVLVSGNHLSSDVTCHLMASRGTPNRECDKTGLPEVHTRISIHVYKLNILY